MALSANQIADILFKKVAASVSTSSVSKNYFEEGISSRLAVFASQIWAEEDRIPETAPLTSDDVVQKIDDLVLDMVPGSQNASYSHVDLKDVIPYNYGDGSYNYVLKNSQGTRIDLGQNDWYLDTESGTLTFFNGVPANMPPKISCYKYVGKKGISSTGNTSSGSNSSYLVVDELTKIANLDVVGSFEGQLACVLQTDELYMWKIDRNQFPEYSSWVKISFVATDETSTELVPNASMTVAGKVKTSSPNSSVTSDAPIVVETNDPRMFDSRVPTLHAKSHWDDSINSETGLPFSTDRIPDVTATNVGFMTPAMLADLNKAATLPYPLNMKLRGQFVSEVFDATQETAPFSEINLTTRAQASGWAFTETESSKGIIANSNPLAKVHLFRLSGDPLTDSNTNKEIYAKFSVVDNTWKLKYYTTDANGDEQAYTFTQTPLEAHKAKVPKIFDLWDMPVFDPTLAAPGAVPDTVPTATNTTLGVVTLGGSGPFAAAPNSHAVEEETAHGGFVSSIKVNGEENGTPPGEVVLKSGAGMSIIRAGNQITFTSSGGGGGATSVFAGADGQIGFTSLSAAPLDASVPIALSESDTRVVLNSQDSQFDSGTKQSFQNIILRSQNTGSIQVPVQGQIVRNQSNQVVEYINNDWRPLVQIPDASTSEKGLMLPSHVASLHSKDDTTSLVNKKRASLIHGGKETNVTGQTLDVSSKMSGYSASNSESEEGIVVFSPYNKVNLIDADTGNPVKDGADDVFGRLTKSGSNWTLSFYKMVGSTENTYPLSSRTFNWYVQRIFNLYSLPLFDTTVSVPSGVVDAVARDASDIEKGVVFVGGTGTEANRAPTYAQLKAHQDSNQAHGGIVNTFRVWTRDSVGNSYDNNLTGLVQFSTSTKFNIGLNGNSISLDTNPATPIHLSAVSFNRPNISLKPGAFPTTELQPGSLHLDNAGELWVNLSGNPGDANWRTVGNDYSIERFVVGGNSGIATYTGVVVGADGKVIQATSTSTAGDSRSIGIVVAVNGGGTSAVPGDTVFVKIDGMLKNVPINNTAQAGDYLILKAGILGKVHSVGSFPTPYAIARAVKPSQNGYVDLVIVRISAGVGAGGTRIIDEWDKESESYADGSAPYPRTADSNGAYRYYLSREPIVSQGVVVVAGNVRQPKAKYRVLQDMVASSANYLKWYVSLKYPLLLDTDTLFVEYFTI
jgi:hypothetical protein